jgi:predicted metal-dependent hydrolase
MEISHIPLGERIIPLAIRRHMRARRISLRLSPSRDGIVMTLPRRTSVEAGMRFLDKQRQWVLDNVETQRAVTFADGASLPVLGQEVILRHQTGRGVSALKEGELHIHGDPAFLTRRVKDFLKKQLHAECLRQARALAQTLNVTLREVRIRDTRSRWGSCTTGGSLTFNWRLVFAPPPVLQYLVAHEVAHLVEMNHSKRFWGVVAQISSDMVPARQWLKKNGHLLYRYQ